MVKYPIVIANWKMNKTIQEGMSFASELGNYSMHKNVKMVICPPALSIFSLSKALIGSDIFIGSQNIHENDKGSFTGEISANMVLGAGANYVIIGHSERREFFNELDGQLNLKVKSALKSGLKIIFCIGETLEQRKTNITDKTLEHQLLAGLKDFPLDLETEIIVAYEPVWAIGTGETANNEQISTAHRTIKTVLTDKLNLDIKNISILYGGSVNSDNSKSLIQIDNVDGFLIGGASLNSDSFFEIVSMVSKFY